MAQKIVELGAGTYDVHDVTAGTTSQVTVPVLTAGTIDQASPTIGDVLTVSGSNATSRAAYLWQSAATVGGTYSDMTGQTGATLDTTSLMEAFFRRSVSEGLQGPVLTDPVEVVTSVELGGIFETNFTTDETSRFSGPDTLMHDPNYVLNTGDFGWPGAGGDAGVVYFGSGFGISSQTIEFDFAEGQQAEIYWYFNIPSTFQGVTYTGNRTKRVRLQYINASGNSLYEYYSEPSAPARRVFEMPVAPAGTEKVRIEFERRPATSDVAPMVVSHLFLRDISVAAPSFGPTSFRPWRPALLAGVNESITFDYEKSFSAAGGVDSISVLDAPAEMGATTLGTELTLSPTAPLTGVQTVLISGSKNGKESLGGAKIWAFSESVAPLSLLIFSPIYLEEDMYQVVDLGSYVDGGLWPYTVAVTDAPAWMDVRPNGIAGGYASGSGAQTAVSGTVTDAAGNSISVSVPINIIEIDKSNPAQWSAADGDLQAASTQAIGNVIQLQADQTYTIGNWSMTNLPADTPFVILGPDAGTAYITPDKFNQCHGVWIIGNGGNIEFQSTLPGGDLETALGSRTANDLRFTSRLRANWSSPTTMPRSFNRLVSVTVRGFETDLSNEVSWLHRVNDDGSPYFRDPANLEKALPTEGLASIGIYRGGVSIGGMTIVQDSLIESSAMPCSITSGFMSAFARNKVDKIRVDAIRYANTNGCIVTDNSFSRRTNCKADEHQDFFQTLGVPVGDRAVVDRNFLVDFNWRGVQAFQFNMGSAGSFDPDGDPRQIPYDIYAGENVVSASQPNGLNPQGAIGYFNSNVTLPDPGVDVLDGTKASIRVGDSSFSASDNLGNSVPTGSDLWSGSGNLRLSDHAPGYLDIFPNLDTPSTYNDPREAVANGAAANTARLWLDPASGVTQGPSWLRDGLGGPQLFTRAPAPLTDPQITGDIESSGTITIVPGTADGLPDPTYAGVLELDGVDVTGDMVGLDYTAPADADFKTLTWTQTWNNTIGDPLVQTTSEIIWDGEFVSATGGTSEPITDDQNGETYTLHTFTADDTFTVTNKGIFQGAVIAKGENGGSVASNGFSGYAGGGGSAGDVVPFELVLEPGDYAITLDVANASGTTTTSAFNIEALSGGPGGSDENRDGQDGGGGGSKGGVAEGGLGSEHPTGNSGAPGSGDASDFDEVGGGGRGSGGDANQQDGGPGLVLRLRGTAEEFGRGGGGGVASGGIQGAPNGGQDSGGGAGARFGDGGGGAGAKSVSRTGGSGAASAVLVRYKREVV